jgi:RNA polymerase sigma-70 factor (ECF subfamily)
MSETPDPSSEKAMVQAGYRFALSLAGDRHEAEDLVQQACLRVLSKKGRLGSRSYLLTAIRNLFYDAMRRKKLVAFEPLETMEQPLPAKATSSAGARMDLESSLNCLSPEEREAVYLNCVEGYTAAEMGEMLGKPRSTVLNILARAKSRLIVEEAALTQTQAKGSHHG